MSGLMLTRIMLGKTQTARKGISDSYAWHQALWEAFPERDGQSRDFLFRVDDSGMDFQVLLLSETEPCPPEWGYWQSKQIDDSFLDAKAYRFQLKVNPTMRRNSDRRRLGIYGEERLCEWLHGKAGKHGFSVQPEALSVGAPLDEWFVRNGRRGKHVAVDFRGILEVRAPELFRDAFCKGIGSAKGFGFGLLMLEPVRI